MTVKSANSNPAGGPTRNSTGLPSTTASEPTATATGESGNTPVNEQHGRGLDPERHAAAQRRAQQAEVLHKGAFPALMAAALSIDPYFETGAYRIYLDRVIEEAGNPSDPVEIMMLQQLTLAHFRVVQLQVNASQAKGHEATKIYTTAAARLLGEFRRTALGLQLYRSQSPRKQPAQRLKLHKVAM